MPVRDIRAQLQTSPHASFFVADAEDRLIGTIAVTDLVKVTFEGAGNKRCAGDVARLSPVMVAADATLEHTLEILNMSEEDTLPVVDDLDSRHMWGVVHHRDVLLANNRALLEAHAEEHDEPR